MKIVKLFSSFNLYGGTPIKILEIGRKSKNEIIYYMYEKYIPQEEYIRFKKEFERTNRKIIEAYFRRNIISHLRKIIEISKNDCFEILHTYFTFGEILGFIFKLFMPEKKWVVSFVTPDKPLAIKYFILKQCYHKLDGVIYITEYVKKEKQKQYPILKKIKSKVIYNGAIIRKIETAIKRESRLELLTIGRLVKWKNTILLIKIVKMLKEKDIDFRLTIIGDGPEYKNLLMTIQKNNLSSNISLIGNTTNVGGYLDMCDVYLHPSLTEGFGIAVAEAMHYSKPVIVSNAGALPELVKHTYNGYVLSPYNVNEWVDTLVILYDNPNLISKIGANSKTRANNFFSIESFVENHDIFYSELIQ